MITPIKSKLFHKLVVFAVILILLTTSAITITLSVVNYKHFTYTIEQDYRNIVVSAASQIHQFVDSSRRSLEGLSWVMNHSKPDGWQREIILDAFIQRTGIFLSLSVVSLEGETLVSSGWMPEKISFKDNETFLEALSGRGSISPVMLTVENLPYVQMAVPVYSLGKVSAVLWSNLNLRTVWNVLKKVTIGRGGWVYIMDAASGRLIADPNMIYVVRSSYNTDAEVLNDLRENDGPVVWSEMVEGVKYYRIGCLIPEVGWIAVVTQPEGEAYIYLYWNYLWAVLITIVICAVAALYGWFWIRQFLNPVHTLHAQVQKVSEGDLDQKVVVSTHDEIGDLSVAFNKMIDALKGYIRQQVETAKELAHARNLALLGTATSKVIHEVGNLLGNITMAVRAIKREPLGPKGEKGVEILVSETDRVRSFLQDFLLFAGKPEMQLQEVSAAAMLYPIVCVHEVHDDLEGKGIRMEVVVQPDLPPIHVDSRLMHVVLTNLTKNGLEAMNGGASGTGGVLRIEVKADGEWLVIDIRDTGPGVQSADPEEIFLPFFTTKGNKGTGLGLAICKSIVEAHGGAIRCESEPGKGAAFIVRVPL